MKLENLLLLAGAIGAGYWLAKKRASPVNKTAAAAQAVTAPMRAVTAIPEEDAELFAGPVIIESYPAYYGYGYPYPWYGGYGGGWGGRRHHHHHGGGGGGHHRGGGGGRRGR